MICPNCYTNCEDSDYFCYACGRALRKPAAKKGSLLVPFLLLLVMSIAGLGLFFATAKNTAPIRMDGSFSWFYIQDGVLHFEPHRYTGGEELIIPEKIAGQPVRELAENCFAGCENLTTVYLPDTLTAIGDGAFYGCSSLRGIFIPSSVTSIGKEAFYGCTALEAICLDRNLHTIGQGAFNHCAHLNYIFFRGTYHQWTILYDAFINPSVGVFCEDGSFYQGGKSYN